MSAVPGEEVPAVNRLKAGHEHAEQAGHRLALRSAVASNCAECDWSTDGDIAPDPMHPSLEDLRLALLAQARQGCWCEHRRKPCEVHDAFDDGLCVMMGSLTRVGPISTEEFVTRTTHDEPLYGLSEEAHRVVLVIGGNAAGGKS